MEILNILLIFVNMLIFTSILWLRHSKREKLINLKKKHKQDLIAYQAKLDAKIDYYKGGV